MGWSILCRDKNVHLEKVRLCVKPWPTSYGTLGRLFSEAQFPCLESGNNNSTYFIELSEERNDSTNVKPLSLCS